MQYTSSSFIAKVVQRAEQWQRHTSDHLSEKELEFHKKMSKLLAREQDKALLIQLLDRCFRSKNQKKIADQIYHLLSRYGIATFFTSKERMLVRLFMLVGKYIPEVSIPQVISRLKQETADVIVPGESDPLYAYLKKSKESGVETNVNFIGEAILGEREAANRLEQYLKALAHPYVETVSVKISTIYSQVNALAFEQTLEVLEERLSKLFKTAAQHQVITSDGKSRSKLVNLDMEEYKDLELTMTAFMTTLDKPEFKSVYAGIVLQAYLPDSYYWQQRLTEWAMRRVANGGSPVKLRIVKGANLEMELTEASSFMWPCTVFPEKEMSDAGFKRMVLYGLEPDHIQAVRVGVASHNLFDLAFAYEVSFANKVFDYVLFEMLEGMADATVKAVQKDGGKILLYAPVVKQDEFINAIAYLVRRLDENTGPDNFLRKAFNLKVGSADWKALQNQFINSIELLDELPSTPYRKQNRGQEDFSIDQAQVRDYFINEPDTDWVLPANRRWANELLKAHQNRGAIEKIPLAVGGKFIFKDREIREVEDKSAPQNGPWAQVALANAEDVQLAVQTAREDPDGWRMRTLEQRREILAKVANEFRRNRGVLIATACAEVGKLFTESDVEVSEAVDFVEYYPWSLDKLDKRPNLNFVGLGAGVVISPWNFPLAIPTGGIAAALSAGNTVILKPAPAALVCAYEICRCFWKAGISQNTLQLLPAKLNVLGDHLIDPSQVDFTIFTGSTDAAFSIKRKFPDLNLYAETGGKNAMIVTAMADRDQVIKDVVYSAFGNSGQKCSATSLLILEAELYDDPAFKAALKDAVTSLKVGSAWDFSTKVGPMARKPEDKLKKGMELLEEGEEWLVQPKIDKHNPYLVYPGVKWGGKPGGFTHLTELFGPVLTVLRAKNLDHAIELANQVDYGLTSGLQSLDEREQRVWLERIQAGNLYINRPTTGAIVQRQPFGGVKHSSVGPGIKAGGQNYVTQFTELTEIGGPEIGDKASPVTEILLELEYMFRDSFGNDLRKILRANWSYLHEQEAHFHAGQDPSRIRGEQNVVRYRPFKEVLVRVSEHDSLFEIIARILAVQVTGARVILSWTPAAVSADIQMARSVVAKFLNEKATQHDHTDEELIELLPKVERMRFSKPGRVPDALRAKAAELNIHIADEAVRMEGRMELVQYHQEQTVSNRYHRYGNITGVPIDLSF